MSHAHYAAGGSGASCRGTNNAIGGSGTGNSSAYGNVTPFTNFSGNFNNFRKTPSYNLLSTSQYYNPLATDSYAPSYDNDKIHYYFPSPLYATEWSPPSGRKSASQTPLFGSIRKVNEIDETFIEKHVYLPTDHANSNSNGGNCSNRSIDDNISILSQSQQQSVQHVYINLPQDTDGGELDDELLILTSSYANSKSPPLQSTTLNIEENDDASLSQQYNSCENSQSLEIEPDEIINDECSKESVRLNENNNNNNSKLDDEI